MVERPRRHSCLGGTCGPFVGVGLVTGRTACPADQLAFFQVLLNAWLPYSELGVASVSPVDMLV